MNERFKKFSQIIKNPKILVIIGFCGILLIFFSSLSGGNEKKSYSEQSESFELCEYKDSLEDELCEMVRKISGSKDISVVITLESTVKYSYAESTEGTASNKNEESQTSYNTESKQSYITVKTSSGGESALLITEQMPEIRGVAIVCSGGDDEIIREKIQNAVMAALNITSKRVYVTGGNSNENN